MILQNKIFMGPYYINVVEPLTNFFLSPTVRGSRGAPSSINCSKFQLWSNIDPQDVEELKPTQ